MKRKEAPDTPYAWIGLQYHLAMASGAGKLTQSDNGGFPEVPPTSVERFLAASL